MDKPILTPLAELLSSRKFILVVTMIIMEGLLRLVPDLKPYANDLSMIIFLALGYVTLHISVEDLIKTWNEATAPDVPPIINNAVLPYGGPIDAIGTPPKPAEEVKG